MARPRTLDDDCWKQLQVIVASEEPIDISALESPLAAGELMFHGYIEGVDGTSVRATHLGQRLVLTVDDL